MVSGRKAPTIQDVARYAQVSPATVSRALSQPERVSESMRERVNTAVIDTGYTLNQAAQSLRKRQARTILVALSDLGNPFFSAILEAVEHEAAMHDYSVLVTNRGARSSLRDYLLSSRADGLLLVDGAYDLGQLQSVAADRRDLPVVILCEDIPGSGLSRVITDNIDASRRATRHLLELGHRRIGHIQGPAGNILTERRQQGWEAALDGASIPLTNRFVAPGDFSLESGAAAARQLLGAPNPPTAVFCCNDEMAIGFISELHAMGLRCPEDVSVIGFDDIAVASRITPPLTTMRQPRDVMGRLATQALLRKMAGEPDAGAVDPIVKPSTLIVRASTAPVRGRMVKVHRSRTDKTPALG